MGMILVYGLIFLMIFSIFAVGLFFYSRKKKSKTGITISLIMILLVVLSLSTNTIDELTISKKDVISDLKNLDIELTNDFDIKNNSVTGMPERIQETEIQITKEDKDKIINAIKNSTNFKSYANNNELSNDTDTEQFSVRDKMFNFKYPEFYSREIYKTIDNIPTRLFLSVYDDSYIIKYQRIED